MVFGCTQREELSIPSATGKMVYSGSPCGGFEASGSTGGSGTVSGTVTYEDRSYDRSGFTGDVVSKAVRFADVEVVRCSDESVVASGITSSTGTYSIPFANTGSPGLYVRVLGRVQPVGNLRIVLRNNTTLNAVSSVVSKPFDDRSGPAITQNLAATISSRAGGIFNILDILTNAADFVTTINPGGGTVSFPASTNLTVYWAPGSWDGTYFDPSNHSLHLLGSSFDRDEYDDDVILHEFGHFLAEVFSKDDSPGGIHYISDYAQDIRLSWSEGWASFISAAVRGTPTLVDTYYGGVFSFEIETPSFSSEAVYDTSELAVASVLWDLLDDAGTPGSKTESFDGIDGALSDIWDVFENRLPASSKVSMEEFWDRWFGIGGFSSKGNSLAFEEISAKRGMAFKTDATPAVLQVGFPEYYSFYSAPGTTTPIQATFTAPSDGSYSVKTFNLENGADTVLQVFSGDTCSGTEVDGSPNNNGSDLTDYNRCGTGTEPDCPANDGTHLASEVTVTAVAGEDYCVRVSSWTLAPPSAGRYGSFYLKVDLP